MNLGPCLNLNLHCQYSTFDKIALDMGIFQTARLAQMHIGYTSLNFPYGYVLINMNLLLLILLTSNHIMNFYFQYFFFV